MSEHAKRPEYVPRPVKGHPLAENGPGRTHYGIDPSLHGRASARDGIRGGQMSLQRITDAARGAGRYQSFAEFVTQVQIEERKMFGWVGHSFYELWPGGRCVDWSSTVKDVEVKE